ncbi:MAG: class I SAM-dependent methyltransferase [Candidatus Hydrogenedentes bacterium]|nr:class I SAM-dependent methyltransferase [Candidatus Hydrogenedentota bacterium]
MREETVPLPDLYDEPAYYDLAFSFRDFAAEVDIIQEAIRQFSRIEVRRVLELGCGSCPHLAEFVARGYEYTGLDLNPAMVEYATRKAAALGPGARILRGDMSRFVFEPPVDFACILLGSLYVTNTRELVSHFDSVGRALRPGGLYFLDWCIDFDPHTDIWDTWEVDRDGVHLRVTYITNRLNRVEQTYRETVMVQVSEGERQRTIEQRCVKRAVYPQEFLAMMAARPDFEFVGWWNNWDFNQTLDGEEPTNRPIAIVRRLPA